MKRAKKGTLMEEQYTIVDAKNKLPSLIHSVETGQAVKLTRHGRPVAVLLSIKDYEKLSRKRGGYWRALTFLRGRMERERIFSESGDFERLRDSTSGREVEFGR
jgi:prevent-host-death family protein